MENNVGNENTITITKKKKMYPSVLLSFISTGEVLRTQEKCIEKHEVQPSAYPTSQAFLKLPECLYNSTIHEQWKMFCRR